MPHRLTVVTSGSLSPLRRAYKTIIFVFMLFLLIVGCNQAVTTPTVNKIPQQTLITPSLLPATSTASLADTQQPSPSPTQPPISVWIPEYFPEKMRSSISLPTGYSQATAPMGDVALEIGQGTGDPASQWIYALVAPFPTVTDGVTSNELHNAWIGEPNPSFKGSPILMDASTLGVLTAFWGTPAPSAVQLLPEDQLVDYAWDNRPSWVIVPFEKINPRWKTLTIDGQSPIRKDFDPSSYPLTVPFSLSSNIEVNPNELGIPSTNRDSSKLTTVAMTGVTAMVRATAYTMEIKGVTYPAEDIGPILADADLTHISNEIPFSPDCPYPSFSMDTLVFCSSPSYIELLKEVGTDIIELTGDHFMDFDTEATLYTLQMYDEQGWPYFGGGANADEARQPVLLENNGNKLAFMGCNVGCEVKNEIPCDAIATDSHPGAAQCDFDWLSTEIPSLREQGYQVIFTFQHREYYTYTTEPILDYDFGQIASFGAAIVSGSQAHQPHGFSLTEGSFIHYGLGNLFFDQYHFCAGYACDDAFIDRHVFYGGQHISTELITIRFVDTARPRLMTPEERARFLDTIFKASGW
jgi:hypothetical protein